MNRLSRLQKNSSADFNSCSLTLHVQPVDFLRAHTDASAENRIRIQHGTTTLAFKFQGGIVVAVDSRASGGSYIGMQWSLHQPGKI